MEKDELDLLSTEQLTDALARRFDCLIVTGLTNRSEEQEQRSFWWYGSQITALGLAEIAADRLRKRNRDDTG